MASRNRIYDIESGCEDHSSDDSDIVVADPNASAAAFLCSKSPDDSLTDSSLEDVHPDLAAGVFLSRFPKSVPEGNLIQRMKSGSLSESSDSIILQVDSAAAAAAFLARNLSHSNEKRDTSPAVNSDDDLESDLMFSTDANTAAAVFLSANSGNDDIKGEFRNIVAAGSSRNFSPLKTKFTLTVPEGPYTAEHFANVPDEWLEGL
jgi:hypothetical protein